MQSLVSNGLSETVRRYRQSIFKLNYKLKCNKQPGKRRRHQRIAVPKSAAARLALLASNSSRPNDGTASADGRLSDNSVPEPQTAAPLDARVPGLDGPVKLSYPHCNMDIYPPGGRRKMKLWLSPRHWDFTDMIWSASWPSEILQY